MLGIQNDILDGNLFMDALISLYTYTISTICLGNRQHTEIAVSDEPLLNANHFSSLQFTYLTNPPTSYVFADSNEHVPLYKMGAP